jgi:hypothetical protein
MGGCVIGLPGSGWGPLAGRCLHVNEASASIKDREILLSKQRLAYQCVLWSMNVVN